MKAPGALGWWPCDTPAREAPEPSGKPERLAGLRVFKMHPQATHSMTR